MTADLGIVRIPDRFESLKEVIGVDRISHVLIEPFDDIAAMKQVVAELKSSVQGKLVFLHGETGSGKTCLAESLPIFLPNLITNVLTSPPDYELPLWRWVVLVVPSTLLWTVCQTSSDATPVEASTSTAHTSAYEKGNSITWKR